MNPQISSPNVTPLSRRIGTHRILTQAALLLGVLLLHGCANVVPPQTDSGARDRGAADRDFSPLPAISRTDGRGEKAHDHQDDLWGAVATRFTLPVPDNERVDAEIARYSKHPDYLREVSERAEPYLYMIVEKLEAANLPLELTLLPIVESAYLPEALSSSSAAGIWQFIPSTGTYYGLERDAFYDGRRDIEASTDAAVAYFSELRGMFDEDWPTIIAAYNGGQGTLLNAIRHNERRGQPTDFWSLHQIRKETQDYPARLFALVKIFSDPEKHGFTPHAIANRPALAQVELNQSISLAKLAELTGMPHEELYRLNPGFGRSITGGNAASCWSPTRPEDDSTSPRSTRPLPRPRSGADTPSSRATASTASRTAMAVRWTSCWPSIAASRRWLAREKSSWYRPRESTAPWPAAMRARTRSNRANPSGRSPGNTASSSPSCAG